MREMEGSTLFNFEGLEKEPQGGLTRGNKPVGYGGVAQLGEHLLCKQGVDSSILSVSTNGDMPCNRLADEANRPRTWAHSSGG